MRRDEDEEVTCHLVSFLPWVDPCFYARGGKCFKER